MIGTLLVLAAAAWAGRELCTYEATVGVSCKFCSWRHLHGEYPSSAAKAEANRLAALHIQDAHPVVWEDLKRKQEGTEE